jgi:ribosome biogenesis GTPase
LGHGTTGALLGPSGAGKSTIINWLLGSERLKTGEVREYDRKGRHTTTHRELVLLPGGGILIDTPGLRELQLLGGGEGIEETFEDIEAIALQCRFSDCRHISEPGCAVLQAVEDGRIDEPRLRSYLKLRREVEFSTRKTDTAARQAHKSRTKSITHQQKRGFRR